ncbi:FAD-binding oxidoreductase [Actinoplanes palleronii]|uniref:Oxidoreductase n=1 Tax=Actinoplanes palleronii TaxID=113570 RepID=A0ABQ4BP34_9ACTN|nr:FAD-binding oxidoreductase [Actinoplanes palleronii]GIE72437.1 oxidoreductase [Actinoplanes palleronii]
MTLSKELAEIVGAEHCLTGTDIGARYAQDLWGSDRKGDPQLVVRPGGTAEVAAILRLCHERGVPVVPQGGMTGLVSGGVPGADEVVLSLERMNRVEELDRSTRTMTVQAGCTLAAVQDLAAEQDLMFPLDVAPRTAATIGGAIATNAGGLRVLLYGMMRELVLGLEVVLADGTIVNGLHKLVKNNAGHDLKQLFIGTEGTLGVVTRATLRLRPAPQCRFAAMCGVADLDAALDLLHRLQAALPGMVSAFEAVWDDAYEVLLPVRDEITLPLQKVHPIAVLIEVSGVDAGKDLDRLHRALDDCADIVEESTVAATAEQVGLLWQARERIPKEILQMQPLFGFDISLPAGLLESYLAEVREELRGHWPAVKLLVFGHLGDGNVHIAVVTGEQTRDRKAVVEHIIYRAVRRHGGSISAEHGIGFEKRPYLHYSRTAEEITLMRLLKQTLDPRGILSPGRILDEASQ